VTRHRFHGDPARFDVLAAFVADHFPQARYIADVAGGQGMLARLLTKKYGFSGEVIDPRGWTLTGVAHRPSEYAAEMADYYDVVVGLHPDAALGEVVASGMTRPTVVVPCCNFWDRAQPLGRAELLAAIGAHQVARGGGVEAVEFAFAGPKNLGLVLTPPPTGGGGVETPGRGPETTLA